ncbi:MAG TPA: hypothetical protein VFG22_15200 [Polyangiales bacterium]|nr:hypothetical protein [Polyangiales bacterium]
MDLTRLYNLTTPDLRQEAERLGVSDTYAMSRGQLIHAIRSRAQGPEPEGLLGKVLGFAKWAIQAAQEEPRKEEAKTFRKPSEVPMPSIGSRAESVPASESAAVPESAAAAAAEPAAVPEPVPAAESEPAAVHESGPPSRPPAGVFARSSGMFEEPFPTRTMARILAEQGHFKRALAIYGMLLREAPQDGELRAEADEARARSRARRSETHERP